MSLLTGLLAVSISIVGWGSYFVPMKRIKKYDPFYFQLLMCTSILCSSLLAILIFRPVVVFSIFGVLSGLLWSGGNILSAQAIKYSGLSKTAPMWMGSAILVSFAWGLFFFKEILKLPLLGLAGIILLIPAIYVISSASKDKTNSGSIGLLLALASGLLFGSYLVPFKLSDLEPLSFLFSMSLGIFVGGLLIYLAKQSTINKEILVPGFLSGAIWNLANIASFFAVANLGIAVGFPLTQVALFVSVLWGLVYFKEIKERKDISKILIGSIILLSGAILLTLSK